MPRLVIYKDRVSDSATLLADAIPNTVRANAGGTYRPRPNDVIMNWGTTETPIWVNNLNGARVLNHWNNLRTSVNKLRSFEVLRPANVPVPDWTTDVNVARGYLQNSGVVIARTILNGSQGDGIIVCRTEAELNAAQGVRMYTRYFKGSREFRVFVVGGVVVDCIEKRKRNDFTGERNKYVRNLANGYVFCHENVFVTDAIREKCVLAARTLGLDIAAIDVKSSDTGSFIILEANSAPGLTDGGQTLAKMTTAITSLINNTPVAALPVTGPPPAPAPVNTPAPAPVNVAPVNTPAPARPAAIGQEEYNLDSFTDIKVVSTPTGTKIYGKIPGFAKRLLLLSQEGNNRRWIGDHIEE